VTRCNSIKFHELLHRFVAQDGRHCQDWVLANVCFYFRFSSRELAGATGVVLLEAEAGLQNFSNSFGFDTEMLEIDESDDVALEFNCDSNNAAKKSNN
jgi:hypothetical protein